MIITGSMMTVVEFHSIADKVQLIFNNNEQHQQKIFKRWLLLVFRAKFEDLKQSKSS